MNKLNMQAIRSRTGAVVKVLAIAVALAFAGLPADTPAPVSAQAVPWYQRVIQVGQFKTCLFVCLSEGFCCTLEGQL